MKISIVYDPENNIDNFISNVSNSKNKDVVWICTDLQTALDSCVQSDIILLVVSDRDDLSVEVFDYLSNEAYYVDESRILIIDNTKRDMTANHLLSSSISIESSREDIEDALSLYK